VSQNLQRRVYTGVAPWYDVVVESVSRKPRRESLQRLEPARDRDLLLCGAGSGLDLAHLPPCRSVTALDLTPAMLRRARERARHSGRDAWFVIGDATLLPFAAASFDAVILHLILAVIPRPDLALAETARVLRPGGRALILDKFLRPGKRAPVRRLVSRFIGPLLTRTDVVFEEALAAAPALRVTEDRPALLKGWFRFITLVNG
jgi:ubiquinone/menaquinone biosynthesis C-methylase UbiE